MVELTDKEKDKRKLINEHFSNIIKDEGLNYVTIGVNLGLKLQEFRKKTIKKMKKLIIKIIIKYLKK